MNIEPLIIYILLICTMEIEWKDLQIVHFIGVVFRTFQKEGNFYGPLSVRAYTVQFS